MKKIKSKLPILIVICFILIFSANSEIVTASVKQSLYLCYSSVIPSLLPFFIICDFLIALSSGISAPANLLAFGSGLITGFPTGVKNVCSLYQNGDLDKKSAISLLHCTANASPAYILAFIGGALIHNRNAGFVLLISQALCAVICAIIFGAFKKAPDKRGGTVKITEAFCSAVTESVLSCLYVCGYIIFFGIFADLLLSSEFMTVFPRDLQALIVGMVEISRGLSIIDFEGEFAIVFAAVILAFSGVSVIMQCISCTVKVGLPYSAILVGKCTYIILMPIISYGIFKYFKSIPFLLFVVFIWFISMLVYIFFDKSKKALYNK